MLPIEIVEKKVAENQGANSCSAIARSDSSQARGLGESHVAETGGSCIQKAILTFHPDSWKIKSVQF
jgi:hypothetical protein